jgi:hypothetical protein
MTLQRMQIDAFNSLAQATIGAAERLWNLNLNAGRLMIDQGAKAAGHLLRSRTPEAGRDAVVGGPAADTPTPYPTATAQEPAVGTAPAASASPRRSPAAASSEPTKPRPRRAVKPVQGTIRNKRKAG